MLYIMRYLNNTKRRNLTDFTNLSLENSSEYLARSNGTMRVIWGPSPYLVHLSARLDPLAAAEISAHHQVQV